MAVTSSSPGPRATVQRLDVLQHVLDGDARDLHLAGGERVEHERVVGIRAVTDADQHATSPAVNSGSDSMTVTTPATRDEILQAALEVFAEKGYHRALVDDIVRASHTSKGAVYHHFPNKEALFLALVDEFAGRLADVGGRRDRGRAGSARQGGGRPDRRARDLRAAPAARPHPAARVGEPGAGLPGQATRGARPLRGPHPGEPRRGGGGRLHPQGQHARGHAGVARRPNEVVVQWLCRGEPDLLQEAVPALAPLLLRSIGARPERSAHPGAQPEAPVGGEADRELAGLDRRG